MIKVLIADDELLVRVGLKTTIDWEEHGFIVVGEAKNGKEAIELFEKHDPDILLTDIKMPIINGLELIQKLVEKKKNLKSIILTHYDDFSYAHKAIKLGASEYILKSNLSSENLLNVLKKLSDEIISSDTKSPLLNSHDFRQKEMLEYILEKAYLSDINKEEYVNIQKRINNSDSYSDYFIVNGKLEYNESKIDNISNSIKSMSDQFFVRKSILLSSLVINDELLYLINLDFDDENKKEKQMEIVEILGKNLKQFFDLNVSFGVSSTSSSILDIPNLILESKTARERCFFNGEPQVIYSYNIKVVKDIYTKVSIDTIRQYVKTIDKYKLHEYIEKIFSEVYNSYNVHCVEKIFIDFISIAKILSDEKNMGNLPVLNYTKFDYNNFNKLGSFQSVKKYILDVYDSIINILKEHNDKYSYVIRKSIEYIKENYKKDISLTDIANYVEISKSYLSLLFKQETGINFSSYLTNFRIEKSKKLLLGSNSKIYEIAEKVGFDNPYYFSRVFKDVVGISCKEYKKQYFSLI